LADILEARRKARGDEEHERIFGSLFDKSSSTSAEDDEEE
jgi:hypothetical protein